ncbi:unnamed protein product [Mesocestoides corti]|uniref:UVR domain-containing protein n=1 Tax=Mesocestoides corti TaxID=53468 RepID=A0A0R3UJ26_MESCO|nr:unnamed protein product [Mesocestoides corti]
MLRRIQFRVVHVTSQDEKFPATQLNHSSVSTKGWRSAINCPYPQQIVIELEKPSRIRKIQILSHQFLIASKIEFFVGDSCGEDTINMDTSRFHRLGYVELSDNESTSYKARELKSVYVNTLGSCFQIFFYKNYANTENPFNQISIIALNFIGNADDCSPVDSLPYADMTSNLKYISPMDDLAFGVYQDPRLVDIIRRLQCQKIEYARQENFDMAKKTRDAIRYIQEAGEQIFRLEMEKQEAVQSENYEEAKEKKDQISQIRDNLARNIDLDSLLTAGVRPQHYSRPIMPRNDSPMSRCRGGYSVKSHTVEAKIDLERGASDATATSGDAFQARHCHNAADERPLPTLLKKQANNNNNSEVLHSRQRDQSSPPPSSPKPDDHEQGLSEAVARQAAVAIDVVGLPLVTLFYSRSWKLRERALSELEERVSREPLPPPVSLESVSSLSDPLGELRSTTFLLKKALGDQVSCNIVLSLDTCLNGVNAFSFLDKCVCPSHFVGPLFFFRPKVLSVYRKALDLIHPTIVEFGEHHRVAKPEVIASIDKLVGLLLQRTGDSSVRIRDLTKGKLVEMGKWPIFRHGGGFWHEILRPFHATTLERLALSQVEIVSDIYADLGTSNDDDESPQRDGTGGNGFMVEDFVTFAVQALEHRSNEVRELAEALVVALYRAEDRALVRLIMPPNDWEAQRQPLYRRIYAKFDRIDGREHSSVSPPSHKLPQRPHEETNLRSGQQNRPPVSSSKITSTAPKLPDPVLTKPSPIAMASPAATASELDLLLSLDKTCIFCGEQNDEFTEEALDMHYWKACPMLRRCPNCKQVVEISGLTDHLLHECPESSKVGGYRRCERCSEAVSNASFVTHNSCKAAPNPDLRCPLCHTDLVDDSFAGNNNEESWKAHLLRECRQNSRISRPQMTGVTSRVDSVQAPLNVPEDVFPGKKAIVKRVNVR